MSNRPKFSPHYIAENSYTIEDSENRSKKVLMKFRGFKGTVKRIRELTKELNEIAESIEIIIK